MNLQETQALLAWSALPFVGERTLMGLLDHAREARMTLAELWQAPIKDIHAIVPLHPRAKAALDETAAQRWRQAGLDAQAVRAAGVDLLLPRDPDAPAALRPGTGRRWPFVFAYGALGLLEEPRVAIVSSQSVTNSGLAVTDALADALTRRDVPLVSSINREAYKASATAAKRHGGPSILVLDRGIAEVFPDGVTREPVAPARVWDESFDPDLQLLLSPFGWRERWSPRSGPRRDALIFDLASVVAAVDLRPGGTMDAECRSAAARGKPILALDRGPDTAEGTRRLWEECPSVRRLPWHGGEDAAGEVLRLLPARPAETGADRSGAGRLREVGQFMVRACDACREGAPRRRVIGAYPSAGVLAQLARAWSARDEDEADGAAWLLADLCGEAASPARPGQLLERVSRGGLLAALVPAAWLESEEFAKPRAEWLRSARLVLAARMPLPVHGGAEPESAVMILERDGRSEAAPAVFAPQQERMGRFHLRRYLQEILAALARRSEERAGWGC